ncbi:outer membrane beta-barrel protein [Rhizobiaceae bacterium]|nr:outer membrane beta-barrel protein [Rhizobiaceae bacterium]
MLLRLSSSLLMLSLLGSTALAQVADIGLRGAQSDGVPQTDDNLNGIDDGEEFTDAAPANPFSSTLLEEQEQAQAALEAEAELPLAANARQPVANTSGNSRALAAQRVGVDPANGLPTPLANRPAQPVQGGGTREDNPFAPIGIRAGTFTLFPTIEQVVGTTSNADFSEDGEASTFSETRASVRFVSDWSTHRLRGGIGGAYTAFLNGESENLPTGAADVELRLDGANDLAVTFGANYDARTESAILGDVVVPAGETLDERPLVQLLSGFAEVSKGGGRFVPTLRGGFERLMYSDATASDGTPIEQGARDNTLVDATLRLAYEVSPGWQPFAEGSIGTRIYDTDVDTNGQDRNSLLASLRGGAAFDTGEKLSGELALGYGVEAFDDDALEDLGGFTVDGGVDWSVDRLTTASFNATTTFAGSTDVGESGSISYAASVGLRREVRENFSVNARILGSLRSYEGTDREDRAFQAEVGADWALNRTATIFGTVGYEKVESNTEFNSYDATTARLGLRLSR